MFERLKRAMVESFVGAVALGFLFAEGIIHFSNIFALPVAASIGRKTYGAFNDSPLSVHDTILQTAAPELIRCFFIFLLWYILLRWLYFTPPGKEASGQTQSAV